MLIIITAKGTTDQWFSRLKHPRVLPKKKKKTTTDGPHEKQRNENLSTIDRWRRGTATTEAAGEEEMPMAITTTKGDADHNNSKRSERSVDWNILEFGQKNKEEGRSATSWETKKRKPFHNQSQKERDHHDRGHCSGGDADGHNSDERRRPS